MTRDEFIDKLDELLQDIPQLLLIEAERLFDSGAVNTEEYGDDFILGRMILGVALESEGKSRLDRLISHNKKRKRVINNLKKF